MYANFEIVNREYLAEREIETEVFERDLSTVTTEFNQKKKELGQLKVKASESAPIKDDEGNELPLKAQLDELPDDMSELEDAIDDSKDKINSIHDNPEVLRKYEEQKKEITELRERLETHATEEDAKRDQLLSLKTPWEGTIFYFFCKFLNTHIFIYFLMHFLYLFFKHP